MPAHEPQPETLSLIRRLYQRRQAARDTAHTGIAEEIHDELINGLVMMNLLELQAIAKDVDDAALHARLQGVIAGERILIGALRSLAEHLHPMGFDDPLGFSGVLRIRVQKLAHQWGVPIQLEVTGPEHPIRIQTQREVLRIVDEALANAIQHADATTIGVQLRYPTAVEELVQLIIHDDGRSGQTAQSRPGTWGMYEMQECAHAANGHLVIESQSGSGTAVVCTFPAGTEALPETLR